MVRSWWLGPLVLTMAGGGTIWAQSASERPVTAGANRDRFMTVTEQGKSPCRCRIIQSGALPDGSKVYLVSAVEDGHRITVVQAPRKTDGVVPATRFYHWTKDNRPPAGVPALMAQDEKANDGLASTETRPLPVPVNLGQNDGESAVAKKVGNGAKNLSTTVDGSQPVFVKNEVASVGEEGAKGKVVDVGPSKGSDGGTSTKGTATQGGKGAGAGAGGGKAADAGAGTKGSGHGGLGILGGLGGLGGHAGNAGGGKAADAGAGTKGAGSGGKAAADPGTKGGASGGSGGKAADAGAGTKGSGSGGKAADPGTKGGDGGSKGSGLAGHGFLSSLGGHGVGGGKAADAGAGTKGAGAGGKAADAGAGTKGAGAGGKAADAGAGTKGAGAGTKGSDLGMKGGDPGATGGKAADASKLPRSVADATDPLNRPLEFQKPVKDKGDAGDTALDKLRKALGLNKNRHAADESHKSRGFAGREPRPGRGSLEAAGIGGDFTLGQPFPVMLGTPPTPVPTQANIPKPPYMAYIPGPEANPYVARPDVGVAPGYVNAFTPTSTTRPIPADFGNQPMMQNAFVSPLPSGPQPTAFAGVPQGVPQGLPPGFAPGFQPNGPGFQPNGLGVPPMSTPLEALPQPKPGAGQPGLLGRKRTSDKFDDGTTNAFTGAPQVAPQPQGIVPLNTPLLGRPNPANYGVQTVNAEVRKVSLEQPIRQLREGLLPSEREKAIEEMAQTNLELHTDAASALLTAAFRDPALSVRLCAIRTLGTKLSGSPQVMGALRALLDDPDARIRTEAEQVLQPAATQLPTPPSMPKGLKGGK